MLKEFKEFAFKGNVMDMAVGIIIGAAFGTMVKSLVNDVIMPPIGKILHGVDFNQLFLTLGEGDYQTLEEAEKAGAAVIRYGAFLNNTISFLIVAFVLFLLIKKLMVAKKKEKETKPAEPPVQEKLLTEIRDLLKAKA